MAEDHTGHRDRLRKTYLSTNCGSGMHEYQLLELLLSYAIPRQDTNLLSHALISRFGSLAGVLGADPRALTQIKGVGENAAVLISLAGRISGAEATKPGIRLLNPAAAEGYCRELFSGERYETMYVISLDKGRQVKHADRIGSGSLAELTVYPRLVVESALLNRAHSVILTHNHPSGDCRPSRQDLETTRLVLDALTPIGIALHDHIIVGDRSTYSMVRGSELPGGGTAEVAAKAAEGKEQL